MAVTHGGKLTLRFVSEADGTACFEVELETAAGVCLGRAAVVLEGGAVSFYMTAGAPPTWLLDAARAQFRALWRARTAQPGGTWPRRVTRWREAP